MSQTSERPTVIGRAEGDIVLPDVRCSSTHAEILFDGAEVRLTIPDSPSQASFAERYAAYIGVADDLPPDLAANLDHYVHGHRKK